MPAAVERPILPHRLYRYRNLSPREADVSAREVFRREIDAIEHPYLWCSTFDRLNDPMEGFYHPSTRLRRSGNYERRVERVYDRKMNVGIASFSDNRNNELMWAHYADNYSGICVAYRTDHLVDALPDGVSLVRMSYDERLPRVAGDRESDVRAIFSQKKGTWAYEREWRVLGPVGRVNMSQDCVTHVYLGTLITPTQTKRILDRFRGSNISVSRMEVDGYQHRWSELWSRARD